jgi:hypothetical protein
MKLWKLALVGTMLAYSCSTKTPDLSTNKKISGYESTEKVTDRDLTSSLVMTKKDSLNEKFLQENYSAFYAKDFSILYGDRLYTNEELLSQSFKPKNFSLPSSTRVMQYFLRNGRQKTFEAAEQLDAKHHQTKLVKNYSLTTLFEDANIHIEGKVLDWLEVMNDRSGGLNREKKYFLGEDEQIMIVDAFTGELDDFELKPAKKAGYKIDVEAEFKGVIVNELSHEIQYKYFPDIFKGDGWQKITAPFALYKSEVPGLRFKNNAQAGEFLSDVADWVESGDAGVCARFFNPLFYISPNSAFNRGPEGRYEYSYKVQRYAMEQVLKNKGYKNPKATVEELVTFASNSDYVNHDEVFILARKHFKEEDFKEIAKIYRRIGVDLLKTMRPYFKD